MMFIENVVKFYAPISSYIKDTYEIGVFKNGQIRGCIVVLWLYRWRKAPKEGPGKAPKWGPPGL
jgi:hypothetical protein